MDQEELDQFKRSAVRYVFLFVAACIFGGIAGMAVVALLLPHEGMLVVAGVIFVICVAVGIWALLRIRSLERHYDSN